MFVVPFCREKLDKTFDLVLLLETKVSNGLSLEGYAKLKAFSLTLFHKCVYLSPNALVLKNCDEIFNEFATFAARKSNGGACVDFEVFAFTPSLENIPSLEVFRNDVVAMKDNPEGEYFQSLMVNNLPNVECLADKYNVNLDLDEKTHKGMDVDISIANFSGNHPLDCSRDALEMKLAWAGSVEKFAVDFLLKVYDEDVDNALKEVYINTRDFVNEPIAVVGMAFRLPGGNNVDEFWNLLADGKEAIRSVPPFRWTKEHTVFPCKDRTFQGGFLDIPIDQFDAKFFGLSPKEAVFLDPQQRLLHEVCWEAMEEALIDPLTLQGTNTGVFVGSWIHDYRDIAIRSTDVDFFRVYMGNSIASEAARLSHFLNTTGPSIATESGCSSAMVAVHMACKSLRNYETNLGVACGVNLLIHPQEQNLLSFVVAPDGRCKTFDSDANGFGRAEGCAVLLLKRYSDAMKDEDNIWGLIRGSAVTQEGISRSLGTPTVRCESLAMESALRDSNIKPTDVSYVEAHGTGTPVGDPMEIAAITKAYGPGRIEPLLIGSVKTNVGHTESVSGITGIIKVLLSMKNEMIPPHLNLKSVNPEIHLDKIPAEIPMKLTPWPKETQKPRIAGVSSFGISGTDGHAIIQEPPVVNSLNIDSKQERPLHIMKISAKCQESLDQLIAKYETLFEEKVTSGSIKDFADIAYSANFGRSTFNHRAIIVAEDFEKAAKILKSKSYRSGEVQSTLSPICFLFTGQGAQYPNMAAKLYKASPIFKQTWDNFNLVLSSRYGITLEDVVWGKSTSDLTRTLYSQTAIFVVEYCLLRLWQSWGVKPDYVLGHSLGEFAAAVAVGALSFDQALMLVAERSRLIDSLPQGKMLVIKADKATVEEVISKYKQSIKDFWVDFAALNSNEQTVVAGDSENIEKFAKYCQEQNLKSIVLASTHAFHSRHMDPILEKYRKVALTIEPFASSDHTPKYISGVEGKLIDVENLTADYWVRHTREKVNFIDACNVLQSEECRLFLEVGPHPVLSAMVMMNLEGKSVACLPSIRRNEEEWTTILDSLSRLLVSEWHGKINWKGFDTGYSRNRVSIPFYQFNRKPIWIKTRARCSELHPLLGSPVPTASRQTAYEQNMTTKKADFAQDHVIGNTVVFPGAGFLEMCLVGGQSCVLGFSDTFMHPRRPIMIKDLTIKSPLALIEGDSCILQTVVDLDDKNEDALGYDVSISRLDDFEGSSGGKWINHVTTKFFPVAPPLPSEIPPVAVDAIMNTWEPSDNTSFYERLPEVGLRFGPKFQSLVAGWKGENGFLLRVKVPENIHKSYLIHPVVADAMIQSLMLSTSQDKIKKKLQVPVHIGEFVWLGSSELEDGYIYTGKRLNGEAYSLLVDTTGTILAYMSSVEFVETTVKLVEGMIHQQSTALPQLWEETWKLSGGPLQRRTDATPIPEMTEECSRILAQEEIISDSEAKYYQDLCTLARYGALDALLKLGFDPKKGTPFNVENLVQSLGILKSYRQYVMFFLEQFRDIGILKGSPNSTDFLITPTWPTRSQVEDQLKTLGISEFKGRIEHRMNKEISNNLPDILIGKVSPLSVLFPTDPAKPSAREVYDVLMPFADTCVRTMNKCHIIPALRKFMEKKGFDERPILNILEVGAGTGSWSKKYMDILKEENFDFKYYYTDISAVFFGPAEEANAEHKKSIVFKKFNMEEDPFAQGFSPESFDMILACEVIHVAKELRPTLQRLRSLFRPNGCFQIYETVAKCPRVTLAFGLLDGYWNFRDYDLRPDHACLSAEKWKETLLQVGFSTVYCNAVYNGVHCFISAQASESMQDLRNNISGEPKDSWIILSDGSKFSRLMKEKLEKINRKVLVVDQPSDITESGIKNFFKDILDLAGKDVENLEGILYLWGMLNHRDQTCISLPFMSLCQIATTLPNSPKVIVVTQDVYSVDGSTVGEPSGGTLIGLSRSIRNEYPTFMLNHMDISTAASSSEQANEVFHNLWLEGEAIMRFQSGNRYIPRMISAKTDDESLLLPNGCDRFQLKLPETRIISDLEFEYLDQYTLGDTEVEVQVKAMALNFRDVFTVLKPLPIFEEMNTVGLDLAGVVTKLGTQVKTLKVGDRVIGMNMTNNLSLPSHIKTEEELLAGLPENLTFNEGVTLPAVFSTAMYCLVNVAKMKKGETVLIHTASGGVGLCAIQLAQHIGANVIATAGSSRKRKYLHNLGIKHVFNSRTTDFGQQILSVTGGNGVDIVLNSITGPGFKEASLAALSQNGRFIEMSKLSIWKKHEVELLRPDVFYEVVDLPSLPKTEFQTLIETLKSSIADLRVKPIPYERFDALNIRGALNFLQKARHIGKVVCVMPEIKVHDGKLQVTTPLFNAQSTYLVTGGLGGIGFEVVKWMLENGASHIAIASRSQPGPEIANQIGVWNKQGCHVATFRVDVADYEQCRTMFESFDSVETGFPPLRGIMHSAGVLQDATLENQTWEKFQGTYQPKVYGTWNLHDLSENLPLEHFVLFSSMAAIIGSPGQANHSASNSFEDTLINYRRSNGLPGISINWGNWGEVGVATEIDLPGVRPVSTKQGLNALHMFLTTQRSHPIVMNFESFGMCAKLFPNIKNYIGDKRLLGEAKFQVTLTADQFWGDVDAAETREEKLEVFKSFIKSTVRCTLKMEADEEIDDHVDFQVLGIDSLMMLEMKNGLQNVLGNRMVLTQAQLKDCNNTAVLADKLVDILEGKSETHKVLSIEELQQLIREDSTLPEHISTSNCTPAKDVADIETVLITGVTGTLGPYLLRELSQNPQIKKIYCLVRPKGKISVAERLEARLEVLQVLGHVDMAKVECLQGDITKKHLGLSEDDYNNLAEEVDAVVHSAVLADHTAKYWKAPETKKLTVRTANVVGSLHVLEFSTHKALKQVLHLSTVVAVTRANSKGTLSEDWEEVGAFDDLLELNSGYPVSKHIVEQLMKEATLRDIPVKVLRLPVIAGESISGRVDIEQNHVVLRWLAFMKLGVIIEKPTPLPLLPVDKCASIAAQVFLHPEAQFDVYNVSSRPASGLDQTIIQVAQSFGVNIAPVSVNDFLDKLRAEGDDSPLAPFRSIYEKGMVINEKLSENPSMGYQREYLCNSEEFFVCPKLLKLLPGFEEESGSLEDIMKRDLKFIQGLGVFEKFGIKTTTN